MSSLARRVARALSSGTAGQRRTRLTRRPAVPPPQPQPTRKQQDVRSASAAICSARSARDVLDVCAALREHVEHDTVNLATAIHRCGKHGDTDPRCRGLHQAALRNLLENKTKWGPRELSNAAWGLARSSGDRALFDAISEVSVPLLWKFSHRELAMLAWSLARFGSDGSLAGPLSVESTRQIAGFSPEALSILAWAFARVECDPALYRAISRRIVAGEKELTAQGLSNLAWSFATKGASLARQEPRKFEMWPLREHETQRILQACLDRLEAPELLGALEPLLPPVMNAQDVANTAWALARTRSFLPGFYAKLLSVKRRKLWAAGFPPAELAMTAWAVARAHKDNVPISTEFFFDNNITPGHLGEMNAHGLSLIAWSLAATSTPNATSTHNAALFAAIALRAPSLDERSFAPTAVVNLAWAFTVTKNSAPELFEHLARCALLRAPEMTAQGLSIVAWSFARTLSPPFRLFQALEEAAVPIIQKFDPRSLSAFADAFKRVGFPSPDLTRAIRDLAKQNQHYNHHPEHPFRKSPDYHFRCTILTEQGDDEDGLYSHFPFDETDDNDEEAARRR